MRRWLSTVGVSRVSSSSSSASQLTRRGTERQGEIDVDRYPPTKVNTVLNICPQGFIMVVERFGKLRTVEEPGLFFCLPFIDRIAAVHDMREMCIFVPAQTATTQDNVRISLEGNVYVKVLDVQKATYKIRRPLYAVLRHAEAAMRASVGLMELDNIFHSRATLNAHTLQHLQEACSDWGLAVTRYEVTGVEADSKIAEAMDLQAAAERRRRETVKTALAEKEAAVLESEGQRERDRNEAEGKKIRAITEAQGFMEEQRLKAEGMRAARVLEAEGIAIALEKIGLAARTEDGQRAMQFLFGKEYVQYMSALGSKSNSTVFIGADVSDIPSVLQKGLAFLGSSFLKSGPSASNSTAAGGSVESFDHASPSYSPSSFSSPPSPPSSPLEHPDMSQSSAARGSPNSRFDRDILELQKEMEKFGGPKVKD